MRNRQKAIPSVWGCDPVLSKDGLTATGRKIRDGILGGKKYLSLLHAARKERVFTLEHFRVENLSRVKRPHKRKGLLTEKVIRTANRQNVARNPRILSKNIGLSRPKTKGKIELGGTALR